DDGNHQMDCRTVAGGRGSGCVRDFSASAPNGSLERAKEIDDFLLLLRAQFIEMFNDLIGLAAPALVSADGFHQIGRAAIVQEENALADTPERSGSELVWASAALRDAIGERFAHVVDEQVRPKMCRSVRKGSAWNRR